MNISLSPFAPENLVSRDGFGSPVPRQPAHLHTQAESGAYGIPTDFRGGVHLSNYFLVSIYQYDVLCHKSQTTICMYVWSSSSDIARVSINRVRLPILLVVS